jgi:hypothetical protein
MDSSPEERLDAIYQAYNTAFENRASDIADAQSDAEAKAIRANVAALESTYLTAERQGLQANGAAVEAAYQAARAAADDVTAAYQAGRALADRIRAVSGAVTATASLLTKAAAIV